MVPRRAALPDRGAALHQVRILQPSFFPPSNGHVQPFIKNSVVLQTAYSSLSTTLRVFLPPSTVTCVRHSMPRLPFWRDARLSFFTALVTVDASHPVAWGVLTARWSPDATRDVCHPSPLSSVLSPFRFFYYFLLLSSFVPVSLYVSLSTCKYFQARFIEADLECYHAPTDTPCKVRATMALDEERGQLSRTSNVI